MASTSGAQARSPRALPAELAEAIRTSAGISLGTASLVTRPGRRTPLAPHDDDTPATNTDAHRTDAPRIDLHLPTALLPATRSPARRTARSVSTDDVAPASALTRAIQDGGLAQPLLPVAPPLTGLLPDGGLRRGSVVSVVGSSALVLALLAEASAAGSWCAEIGSPLLGSTAAVEAGIVLERFVRVPTATERWAEVAAALVDGFDLVVLHPPPRRTIARRTGRVSGAASSYSADRRALNPFGADRDTHRLAARARERGTVLIATDWWDGAQLRLTATTVGWHGIGTGYGHLAAREVEVNAIGRGNAARPRQVRLWLPGPDGKLALAQPRTERVETSDIVEASHHLQGAASSPARLAG